MSWDQDMQDLAEDVRDTFGVEVTVVRRSTGAFNAATGVRASTVQSSETVTADRSRTREYPAGDGKHRIEEITYRVVVTDLAGRPDSNDLVQDGGVDRPVVRCEMSLDRAMYELVTQRRVAIN
jgi:hypothetical protein